MLYLDYLANNNALKHVSIGEKLILGGGGLLLSLVAPRPITLLSVIIIMHSVILYARIPLGYIVRLWLAPLLFLLVSLVTVVFSASTAPFFALYSIKLGSCYVGVTGQGLLAAQQLLLRSLAAVSCLFMLATTTPVVYIVAYLSRIPGLRAVMEIMLLTYRFIFVFLAAAGQIYTAQQSRLGYAGPRRSLNAISMLAANLGRKSFMTARELYIALLARNYSDRLVFRYPRQRMKTGRLLVIMALLTGAAWTAFL